MWAAGLGGVAIHRDSAGTFSPQVTGTDHSLRHILADESGRLVVFAEAGAILEVDAH